MIIVNEIHYKWNNIVYLEVQNLLCKRHQQKEGKTSKQNNILPILEAGLRCLVLLWQHKVHEIFISHLPLNLASKLPWSLEWNQSKNTAKIFRQEIICSTSKQHLGWATRQRGNYWIIQTYLWKYSINDPVGEGMITISDEVIFVNQEIMVHVQLPEFTVYDVKMFIRKVSAI